MIKSNAVDVLYLCDGKACGPNHDCYDCKHTTDINHAKNFELLNIDMDHRNELIFVEKEEKEKV